MSARLSQTEVEQNKIDAFNLLQKESKKVYNQIINILKETETKKPFVQGGFCKKIKDQINSIKAPKPIRFYINFSVYSVWLCIDTHYTIKNMEGGGQIVEYLKNQHHLCSCKDNILELASGSPEFKKITIKTYNALKAQRRNTQDIYERAINNYNSKMPSVLR